MGVDTSSGIDGCDIVGDGSGAGDDHGHKDDGFDGNMLMLATDAP